MPLFTDKQIDLNWKEQDKIRRRLEIKNRLKDEGIRRRFDPFGMVNRQHFVDPAHERYADLRKRGRMPGAPFRPGLFFGMVISVLGPMVLLSYLVKMERDPWRAAVERGDIPVEQRSGRSTI